MNILETNCVSFGKVYTMKIIGHTSIQLFFLCPVRNTESVHFDFQNVPCLQDRIADLPTYLLYGCDY